jgi:hypothetical protein
MNGSRQFSAPFSTTSAHRLLLPATLHGALDHDNFRDKIETPDKRLSQPRIRN